MHDVIGELVPVFILIVIGCGVRAAGIVTAEAFEQVEDLRLHRDVEGRHRLVADDELRLGDHRPGDGDALALATGELVGPRPLATAGSSPTVSSISSTFSVASCLVADLPDVEALGDDVLDRRRGLSDEIGSWKIIWMLGARAAQLLAVERR